MHTCAGILCACACVCKYMREYMYYVCVYMHWVHKHSAHANVHICIDICA